MERASELVQCCKRIAEVGNAALLSDVASGAILASSAGEGAALMVRINLRSIKNDKLVDELDRRLRIALTVIAESIHIVTRIVEGKA